MAVYPGLLWELGKPAPLILLEFLKPVNLGADCFWPFQGIQILKQKWNQEARMVP